MTKNRSRREWASYSAQQADQACQRLTTTIGALLETLPGFAGLELSEVAKLVIAVRAIRARLQRRSAEAEP